MAATYAPLPTSSHDVAVSGSGDRRRYTRILWISLSLFLVLCIVSYTSDSGRDSGRSSGPEDCRPLLGSPAISRGPAEGVSEKSPDGGALRSSPVAGGEAECFGWTNDMLLWQRTAFHFQPVKNWMNDPNGPLYYKGWYHLFYQYNPDSAVWGNITWGHAISRDLIHWVHLPIAVEPDHWYDINGAWTGSATFLPDGNIVMLYTGSTNESVQVQNLMVPSDPSDPFLLHWTKSGSNPVLTPPPNIGLKDFRDPTTAWWDPQESTWRIGIGSKDESHAGIAVVYKTKDFVNYQLIPGNLHRVAGTGMWECLDFYPVATDRNNGIERGLDTSARPVGVRHVMKASMDDDRHDYYAIGTYDMHNNVWTPDDETADVGIGLRYDWGKFYASKTFFDPATERRILWGWIGETDSELTDIQKGWASVQAIPRTVLFDSKTKSNLIQWPVEEVEGLRLKSKKFSNIKVSPESVIPLDVPSATQLDIVAEFEVDTKALTETFEADVGYNCSTSGGAAARGLLGPFGILVLADDDLTEKTATYFYIARGVDGQLNTHFCQDETQSSKALDIVKRVVGSTVPVLDGENLTLRILVDHSIVESFAQQGRTCLTSRVYPTMAIYNSAKIFLFNNATRANLLAKSITVWEMDSSFNHIYPGPI